jgi:hypothetical protein
MATVATSVSTIQSTVDMFGVCSALDSILCCAASALLMTMNSCFVYASLTHIMHQRL